VNVPQNFAFLKYLSNDYSDKLLSAMDALPG